MNTIRKDYRELDKQQKFAYKSEMMKLFGWVEQTFYRKLLKDYEPTGAEEQVSQFLLEKLNITKS